MPRAFPSLDLYGVVNPRSQGAVSPLSLWLLGNKEREVVADTLWGAECTQAGGSGAARGDRDLALGGSGSC